LPLVTTATSKTQTKTSTNTKTQQAKPRKRSSCAKQHFTSTTRKKQAKTTQQN
jgi:hypothetical protein